ncbi:MAG: S1/P1 nuclease [Phycisphaerales bacterium JB040]
MTTPRRALALAAAIASLALLAGWGREGHAIVAQLAWMDLTPEAQAKVAALLEPEAMAEVGSWADAVRPTDEYRWTAPLHYVNMPDHATRYIHDRDCPDAGCVVSAIDDFAATLADDTAPHEDRVEALKFVIHFVADIHQPLHAGRPDDRGGNDIDTVFFGRERNLHSVWDSGIIQGADLGEWPQWASRLAEQIDDADRLAWTADANPNDWANTAGRWAYESNRLALEYAYTVRHGDTLDDAYVRHTLPVVELRLQQAGVRLADLLNTVLADE